jgi:hypothetical protein
MRRLFLAACLVFVGIIGLQAPAVTHAAGNSDAAHACQQGGYLNLQGTDGTTFKNAGQCVSYVARGGTIQGLTGCAKTTTSGCLTLDNLSISYHIDSSLGTIALSGALSFSPLTTCGIPYSPDPTNPLLCGTATGGGTYSVSGGTFNQGTGGTFTVSGPIAYGDEFVDSTRAYSTCAQATGGVQIVVVPITFTDTSGVQDSTNVLGIAVGPLAFPAPEAAVFVPNSPEAYDEVYSSTTIPGVTINC